VEKTSTTSQRDPRRDLPSVSVLLEMPAIKALITRYTRPLTLQAINNTLDAYRRALRPGDAAPERAAVAQAVETTLAALERDRMRYVVNATGIILHTGLGRAVLPQQAAQALAAMSGCCNMQIDLATGLRGKRSFSSEMLLCRLTGAEAALVVNNNAAATFLILAALCPGREVIVSRGQLIEIGGSYRLPDCIRQSGAVMREVGTTNKTHLRDYEQALTENTGALLHVNPSNYRVIGFSKSVSIEELVSLRANLPLYVIDDLGCGALVDLAAHGLPHEPTVQESVAAGADIVCFSGDKLIGGPQAGIIVGRRDLIARIKKHPLTRMLRICKLTDAALESALRLFLTPETLCQTHPTLRMIATPAPELRRRAQALKRRVQRASKGLRLDVVAVESEVGGGSLPGVGIPSWALAVRHAALSTDALSARLRRNEPPVIARIHEDAVLLDMRTLLEGEDRLVAEALARLEEG